MASPEDHPLARRYRAARAWADLEQDELASRLGVDRQTVIRRESGEKLPKAAELIAVASICGVPEAFMLNGFAGSVVAEAEAVALADRLAAIERRLGQMSREGVERDLDAADERRRRDAGTDAREEDDPDARETGGEG